MGKYYNTPYFQIYNRKRCEYCGKEMEEHIEWDEYWKSEFYNCDCENATLEHELKIEIEDLKDKLYKLENHVKGKSEIVRQLKFEKGVIDLKNKYEIKE